MQRAGDFLSHGIAGFAANVSLGFMLGLVPVALAFYGLPVEVRHVTLSSGQLAAAVVTLGWGVAAAAPFWLAVSFVLALQVAIRARDVERIGQRAVYRAILRRMAREPASFLFPKKES
jgi:site-specific recombinase